MARYVMERQGSEGGRAWVLDDSGKRTALPNVPRPGRRYAGGTEWGYGGAGPLQLAYNILHHATGDRMAAHGAYRAYCAEVVANQDGDRWETTTDDVWKWLHARMAAEKHPSPGQLADTQAEGQADGENPPDDVGGTPPPGTRGEDEGSDEPSGDEPEGTSGGGREKSGQHHDVPEGEKTSKSTDVSPHSRRADRKGRKPGSE